VKSKIVQLDFERLKLIKKLRELNHSDIEIMQLFGLKFGTNPDRYFKNITKLQPEIKEDL